MAPGLPIITLSVPGLFAIEVSGPWPTCAGLRSLTLSFSLVRSSSGLSLSGALGRDGRLEVEDRAHVSASGEKRYVAQVL